METIKFKGYNKKNQKWLYGYYLRNRGIDFICPEGFALPDNTWEDFVVEPNTVRQLLYTLSDGTELYRGDTVVDKQGLKYTLSCVSIVVEGLKWTEFNPKEYKPIKN